MRANRGYEGWSMSVRAGRAYEDGEKPISKIGKADRDVLIAKLNELGVDTAPFASITVKAFREFVGLYGESSRHHTSKRFNLTTFYAAAAALSTIDPQGPKLAPITNIEDLTAEEINPYRLARLGQAALPRREREPCRNCQIRATATEAPMDRVMQGCAECKTPTNQKAATNGTN